MYIKNLKYLHLTPVFDFTISIQDSLPSHTNSIGYCVLKNVFKDLITNMNIHQIYFVKDNEFKGYKFQRISSFECVFIVFSNLMLKYTF